MNTYYPDTKQLIVKDDEWQQSIHTTEPWVHWEFMFPTSFNETVWQLYGFEQAIKEVKWELERYKKARANKKQTLGYKEYLEDKESEVKGLEEKMILISRAIWFDSAADLRAFYIECSNMWMGWQCRECKGRTRTWVEYSWDSPEHYDGISEWHCSDCWTRYDRWTDEVLEEGEIAKRYGWKVFL